MAITLSTVDHNGFFTLGMLDSLIHYNDMEIDANYEEFWEAMTTFLSSLNDYIYRKRKKKNVSHSENKSR